jgi:cell wall-associated NlpC family hydrolase
LLLFANTYKRGISHIGVYLGQNKFVHAATSGTGVRVSSLAEKYYAGKYFGARRAKMAR